MSAPCKERWKHLKGGRISWHKMAYSEPVQRREDTVLDSKPVNRCCAAPAYLPASAVCLAACVFCIRFLAVLFLSTGQRICWRASWSPLSPMFHQQNCQLVLIQYLYFVDEAKWIRKNTAMYTKYKFGNLILMRGTFISCSSGEICCGSTPTANADLLRGRFPWP